MVEKMNYQTPKWKIMTFENQDVVTSSGPNYDDGVNVNGSDLWNTGGQSS